MVRQLQLLSQHTYFQSATYAGPYRQPMITYLWPIQSSPHSSDLLFGFQHAMAHQLQLLSQHTLPVRWLIWSTNDCQPMAHRVTPHRQYSPHIWTHYGPPVRTTFPNMQEPTLVVTNACLLGPIHLPHSVGLEQSKAHQWQHVLLARD